MKLITRILGIFNSTNIVIFGYLFAAFWIWLLYPYNWIPGFFSGFFFGMFTMRMITKIKQWIEK